MHKNLEFEKSMNTAEIVKNPQFEIQSNNSVIEHKDKTVDLSDILRSIDGDTSGFQNLLEDEILSEELAQISHDGVSKNSEQEIVQDLTPNFPNRVKSKLDPKDMKEFSDQAVNLESKYFNISLGDIPEEHEEMATFSEQNPSSLDKFGLNNTSGISHRGLGHTNNVSASSR